MTPKAYPVKTGARELLQWARDNAYTIGLASSTRQAVVEKELSERGLLPYFDYVLGGDRIARSKPAPDIYETACRALHAVPADTYAIEDSYNGIRAAPCSGHASHYGAGSPAADPRNVHACRTHLSESDGVP